ncbi:MAG: hypothetical protein ACK5IQ_07005 [Bacteroidales bacterium]
MKKTLKIILFGILCIVSVLSYLKYDSKHYDYGFSCTFCGEAIPYGLKPYSDRYYSFALLDEDEFELVGKGFKYQNSSFKINEILGYGYNDTSVIVKCTDSLNNIKYLTSYETKYKSSKGNPEISFKDLNINDSELLREHYYWIDLDDEKGDRIRLYRTLSFIAVISTFLLLLWVLIRKRKATQ